MKQKPDEDKDEEIREHLKEGKTYSYITKEVGVSRSRISRIKNEGIESKSTDSTNGTDSTSADSTPSTDKKVIKTKKERKTSQEGSKNGIESTDSTKKSTSISTINDTGIIKILQENKVFLWNLYQTMCTRRSFPNDDMTRFQNLLREMDKELDKIDKDYIR